MSTEAYNEQLDLTARLEQLGVEHKLERKLNLWQNIGLSMADVGPTMAVFLLAIGSISLTGTGTFDDMLIVGVGVFFIALCLGELGSIYPVAGGVYSLVRYTLPGVWAPIAMFNLFAMGIIIPASLILGAAQFLLVLFPGIPLSASWVALILTIVVAGIAFRTIRFNADITIFMVIVELGILSLLTIGGLFHIHHSVSQMVFHPVYVNNGHLVPASFGVMLAALAATFNIINGYDSTLGFAEETKGTGRTIAYAAIISAVLAAVLMIVPLGISILAAPNFTGYITNNSPPVYTVHAALGGWASTVANAGVTLSLFNSGLACLVYYARIWFASGRDGVWPGAIGQHLSRVNRYGAPWVALLICLVPWVALLFLSSLNWLIIFSGSVLAAEYFCMGLAGFWGRIGPVKSEPRPFKMPLWPVPPIIAMLITGFALIQQDTQYKVGEAILVAAAILFYFGSRWVWSAPPPPRPVEAQEAPVTTAG